MRAPIEYIRKWFWRIVSTQQKILLTYLVLLLCWLAVTELEETAPIYPVGYHTLVWFLALLFPTLAVAYSIARIRVRQNEIMDVYRRDRLWDVYFPESSEPEFEFERHLRKRVAEIYSLWEFAGFSLLAGTITFIMSLLIAKQFAVPSEFKPWPLIGPNWAVLVGSAFLGSYSGCVIFMLRRYRTFDLRPITFLQIMVVLIAGTLAGSFITILFPVPELGVLAFIIGFLSAINVRFLDRLMHSQFARLTGSPLPKEIESDLPKVVKNTETIESLNRISIFSVRELSSADPVWLFLNMPQHIDVIGAMIDEAILHSYFSTMVPQLENAHIHRFTQLLLRHGAEFQRDNIVWHARESIVDGGGSADKQLLLASRTIVDGGFHHRVLGLLLHQYREAFFRVRKSNPGT